VPHADYENPPQDVPRLGGALMALRWKAGLRQRDLSALTGMPMPASQVSDIEPGKNNPGWSLTIRLLHGMGRGVPNLAAAYPDAGPEV
jgi:hypothetical protein